MRERVSVKSRKSWFRQWTRHNQQSHSQPVQGGGSRVTQRNAGNDLLWISCHVLYFKVIIVQLFTKKIIKITRSLPGLEWQVVLVFQPISFQCLVYGVCVLCVLWNHILCIKLFFYNIKYSHIIKNVLSYVFKWLQTVLTYWCVCISDFFLKMKSQ